MQDKAKNRFSADELSERARRYGAKSRETLQIAERLSELLPKVLRNLKSSLPEKGSNGDRAALVHPEYRSKLDQYIEVLGEGLEARIQFECHRMMLQAMQSQNAFNRARLEVRSRTNPLK